MLRQRLHQFITAVAAYASKQLGRQEAEDRTPELRKHLGKNYRRPRTQVFGTTPPNPDPGGTHAYMMRHR
jgi:hypothetical protein